MKKMMIVILFGLVTYGNGASTNTITRDDKIISFVKARLAAGDKVHIAVVTEYKSVVELDPGGQSGNFLKNSYEQYFSSLLLDSFSSFDNFALVERSQLDPILRERKLSYTGLMELPEIERRLLKADYIIYLDIVDYSENTITNYIAISGKLIEVKTGQIHVIWKHILD